MKRLRTLITIAGAILVGISLPWSLLAGLAPGIGLPQVIGIIAGALLMIAAQFSDRLIACWRALNAAARLWTLCLLVLAVATIGLEMTALYTRWGTPLRVRLARRDSSTAFSYSDYLPVTLAPGSVDPLLAAEGINELGYRGEAPRTLDKPATAHRILVLGDSFVYGPGIDTGSIFTAMLEQELNPGQTGAVEVINAAYHAAYSPDSYYAYLLREGYALDPDLLIIFLNARNDLLDVETNVWRSMDETGAPTNLFTTRSYGDHHNQPVNPGIYAEAFWYYRAPVLRESALFVGMADRMTPDPWPHDLTQGDLQLRIDISVRAILARSEERRIPVALVLISPYLPLNDSLRAAYAPIMTDERAVLSVTLTGEDFLSPAIMLPEDVHLNEEGHALFAEYLAQWIAPVTTSW